MSEPTLSVIVPAYDEEATLATVVRRLREVPLKLEIVAVNDASKDGTAAVIDRLVAERVIDRAVHHPTNRGKGAQGDRDPGPPGSGHARSFRQSPRGGKRL